MIKRVFIDDVKDLARELFGKIYGGMHITTIDSQTVKNEIRAAATKDAISKETYALVEKNEADLRNGLEMLSVQVARLNNELQEAQEELKSAQGHTAEMRNQAVEIVLGDPKKAAALSHEVELQGYRLEALKRRSDAIQGEINKLHESRNPLIKQHMEIERQIWQAEKDAQAEKIVELVAELFNRREAIVAMGQHQYDCNAKLGVYAVQKPAEPLPDVRQFDAQGRLVSNIHERILV